MKLLFDHNLSKKLVRRLADVFPGSTQTQLLNFGQRTDEGIWDYARSNGLTIVTLDRDFSDLSLLRGSPPKVIWLRCGNSKVARVEELLRKNLETIAKFLVDPDSDLLEVWP